MKNGFLKVFIVESLFIAVMMYFNRNYYLFLEDWMINLDQNQFTFYTVEILFNGLNAAFCFLLGSALVKVKKKKYNSGPYHF